jgi:hypothetical protein
VHYLSSPCTLSPLVVHSLSRLCTSIHPLHLFSAFIPCVHHVHLDPSIAPLYLLRYSTADPLNSLSTFRAKPPIVHVGHYGQPTVTVCPRSGIGCQTRTKALFVKLLSRRCVHDTTVKCAKNWPRVRLCTPQIQGMCIKKRRAIRTHQRHLQAKMCPRVTQQSAIRSPRRTHLAITLESGCTRTKEIPRSV